MTDYTAETQTSSISHHSDQEERDSLHNSDTRVSSSLERDPPVFSSLNENPNKLQLLDNELTAACAAVGRDLPSPLSRAEENTLESQSKIDTTISPSPLLHHNRLFPPAPPNNTPDTASPGLGGVSPEEVYHQVPDSQTLTAPAFAAKGIPMSEEKGDVQQQETVTEDVNTIGQDAPNEELAEEKDTALMESNAEHESGMQNVHSLDILEQLMEDRSAMIANPLIDQLYHTATSTEQPVPVHAREVSSEDVDENSFENFGEIGLSSTNIANQPQPASDGNASYAAFEDPCAIHSDMSPAQTATPLDEADTMSNGSQVYGKQNALECDVESLAITDPAVLCHSNCQTVVIPNEVSESLHAVMSLPKVERTDATRALPSDSLDHIDTAPNQDDRLAMSEAIIAASNEAQLEESDNVESKGLKRAFGEIPMTYPKSVLERKPEVEIKKNLFGETSTVINGENSANMAQSQEGLLNTRMTEPCIDPTEPHKSPKTEHYDAHGREAYIEVSKVDCISPEADAEENLAEPQTNDTNLVQVPLLDEEFNIVHAVSSGTAEEPSSKSAGEHTYCHSGHRNTGHDGSITEIIEIDSSEQALPQSKTSTLNGTGEEQEQNSVDVLLHEDAKDSATSGLPLKDSLLNSNDTPASNSVRHLQQYATEPATGEGLPAKEALSESNDTPASTTIRQRIKGNEVSDTVPLAESAKDSVVAKETGSFTLRVVTCGMVAVTVFMLSELLFPSQMEYILTRLMDRTQVWKNARI